MISILIMRKKNPYFGKFQMLIYIVSCVKCVTATVSLMRHIK